jgi:hypothetical protein
MRIEAAANNRYVATSPPATTTSFPALQTRVLRAIDALIVLQIVEQVRWVE